MKFTIFTPTYNRKELLKKLYFSLQNQTFKDFEWLIVDDGSNDGTNELVKDFLKEKKLDIKYFFKENGGKQRAYNFALEKAQGELFICLDSDDEYKNYGLEIILKYLKKYENNKNLAGMGYLSTYPDGKIIGSAFPKDELIATQFEVYNKYGVTGDKGLVFFTKIIKKFPFPVFDGEKFVTEAVVYNRICRNYKMLYVNEKIEVKDYQNDGLTAKYNNLLLKNPKGQALYHNEINFEKLSFKQRLLNNAVYYKFCRFSNYSYLKSFKECNSKLFFVLGSFLGFIMWLKDKKNF